MRAINNAVDRVRISIILPKLIDNRPLLMEKLKNTEYTHAINLVDNFYKRRDYILREQRAPLMDHGMIQIIDFFQMNNEMYLLFKRLMNKMSHNERKLLYAFESLEELAKRRLFRDTQMQFIEERKLQAMYNKYTATHAQMEVLRQHIRRRELRLKWVQAANQEFKLKCNQEIKEKTELYERAFLQEE